MSIKGYWYTKAFKIKNIRSLELPQDGKSLVREKECMYNIYF